MTKSLVLAAIVAAFIAAPVGAAEFNLDDRPAWGSDPTLKADIMTASIECGQFPSLDADGDTFCAKEFYQEFFARALTAPEGVKALQLLVPYLVDFYPEDTRRVHPGD